ncbi:MAG: zinc-binding dehydrogenase [Actinobacteria bacterium]|nr:zinc-binding dehydrogenase [Actinomycetota bacterium]
MALALELFRSVPRYVAARTVGRRAPGLIAGPLAPLRLVSRRDPEPHGEGWARVKPLLSGICGSDLATISGTTSFYFTPLVSLPFVPGHEVVGELLDDCGDLQTGQRVVLSSVLACAARGEDPVCANCAAGDFGRCDRITVGDLRAGLQTGYCADTGGGWSRMMLAHRSQLFAVPDEMSVRSAVLVEPMAAAVHTALRAQIPEGGTVLVIGAGTVGILTALAIQRLARPGRMIVAAKHPRQRAAAKMVGATEVVRPEHAVKAVRRGDHAVKLTPERGPEFLLGGVDVAIDCVGSKSALDLALRTTRAGGRVVLSGIPAGGADLTPLWFRELELVGAYTGGTEDVGGERRATFDVAMEIAGMAPMLQDLVGAVYALERWREALDHALGAGTLGTFKVAFAPQET